MPVAVSREGAFVRILNISAQKPDSTGSGVFLNQTVRCMAQAGHEVAVICGVGPTDDPTSVLPRGTLVRAVRFQTSELPFAVCGMSDVMPYEATRYRDMTPEMTEQFKSAFRAALHEVDEAFEPDVVICHHLYVVCALAREVLPHRVVVGISHSTDLRQMAQHGLERDFILRNVRALDAVCALHEEQAREIERDYGVPRARIHVIGTGYDARMFNRGGEDGLVSSGAWARKAADVISPASAGLVAGEGVNAATDADACAGEDGNLGLSASQDLSVGESHASRLLYVGKIGRKKGVLSLLEAYDALARRGIACALDLVGGHSDEVEYACIVERAARCERPPAFLGKVPSEELVRRYRAADVFVLPSFFEGLPLVVVEALACGCKVVVTDLPGVRPWLDQFIPDAPIVYVPLPPLHDVDEPDPAAIPAFETRLADAIERALALPPNTCDTTSLTWERLVERVLGVVKAR